MIDQAWLWVGFNAYMLAHTAYKIDTLVSLGVVAGILAVSVVASLLRPARPVVFAAAAPAGSGREGGPA